jgi:hypothetical protein
MTDDIFKKLMDAAGPPSNPRPKPINLMTIDELMEKWKEIGIDSVGTGAKMLNVASTGPVVTKSTINQIDASKEIDFPMPTPYIPTQEPFTDLDKEVFKLVKQFFKENFAEFLKCNQHLTLADDRWMPFVAGGSVVMAIQQIHSVLKGGNSTDIREPIKDYDIFFPLLADKSTAELVMGSLIKRLNPQEQIAIVKCDTYREGTFVFANYFKNDNVVYVGTDDETKFQFVFNKKDRAGILEDFDYLHCKASYDLINDKLHITPKVYDAIINKKLILTKPEYTYDKRRQKFLDRGYVEEGAVVPEESLGDILNRALKKQSTSWQQADRGTVPGPLQAKVSSNLPNEPPVWKQAMDITK